MIRPARGVVGSAWLIGCMVFLFTASAVAFQPAEGYERNHGKGHDSGLARKAPLTLPATGTVQAAFTPGDDGGKLITDAIDTAQHQVLVQTFSFTHRKIADALVAAKRRGVDVKVISDKNQIQRIPTSLIWKIAAEGVPVFADSDHDSAHNKVIVIDAGSPDPTLITGSFNFTHAAQYKNAENVLLIKGNAALTDLYRRNWQHHYEHSLPYQQR
jgi:phosphatidylserine/phosphatidylglycerophosphate/cardiolipin synthase-like enzyme